MLQDVKSCKDREAKNQTLFGGLLLRAKLVTNQGLKRFNVSNATFVEFSFLNPVAVSGWTVLGREGSLYGPIPRRRGFVASYNVTSVNDKGKTETIKDPDTKEKVSCTVGR